MVMLTRRGGRTSMLVAVLGLGLALAVPPSYAGDGSPTTCLGRPVTVAGTPGDDGRSASSGDVVAVYAGDDAVYANNADPSRGPILACGGSGSDQLFVTGGSVLSGGNGSDFFFAGTGVDVLKGGPGNDYLDATLGNQPTDNVSDVVDGGPGVDECIVNPSDKVKNCEIVEVRD